MIIETKIEWRQRKSSELSEVEEAKRIVLGDDYVPPEDEDKFEDVMKNALIDVECEKIYIEIDDETICITRLLDAQYVYNEKGGLERIEERVFFKGILSEIKEKLTAEKLLKNK